MKNKLDLRIERMHNRFIRSRKAYEMDYLANTSIPLDLRTYAANCALCLVNLSLHAKLLHSQYNMTLDDSVYQEWVDATCAVSEKQAELNLVIQQMTMYI